MWFTILVVDGDLFGVKDTSTLVRGFDGYVGDVVDPAERDNLLIVLIEKFSLLSGENIKSAFANNVASLMSHELFPGPIELHIAELACIFDENHMRDVLDN